MRYKTIVLLPLYSLLRLTYPEELGNLSWNLLEALKITQLPSSPIVWNGLTTSMKGKNKNGSKVGINHRSL